MDKDSEIGTVLPEDLKGMTEELLYNLLCDVKQSVEILPYL